MLAKVSKVQRVTKDVVFAEFNDFKPFTIDPGQFITVDVAPGIKRAYGVSNAPIRALLSKVELYVDITPGGLGSIFFETIKLGDKVSFSGPYGDFSISNSLAKSYKKVAFLATGTGISPIKAMIDSLLAGGSENISDAKSRRDIRLYFGLRSEKNIFLNDHFKALQLSNPGFLYTLSLSRPGNSWNGCSGYVTKHLLQSNIKLNDYDYFVCGAKATSEQIINLLKEKGVSKEKLHFEGY